MIHSRSPDAILGNLVDDILVHEDVADQTFFVSEVDVIAFLIPGDYNSRSNLSSTERDYHSFSQFVPLYSECDAASCGC